LKLKEWAPSLGGREQLAAEAFASALEIIPKTLAENAGLDPIDVLVDLKSEHEKGNKFAGVDVDTGKIVDMKETGVLEPLRIKTQAIESATEVAVMLLRIDDVIAAKELSKSKEGGEGGEEDMGGMGGMGGMGF